MNGSDNGSTLTLEAPVAVRYCGECNHRLRPENTSEPPICNACLAKKMEAERKHCPVCGKPLNRGNTSGYCTNHFHLEQAVSRPRHRGACSR